jgi:hypothetical protein
LPSIGWRDDAAVGLDPEDLRRRRARNWAMLVVLLSLSVLFFLITIVKMARL